MKNKKSIPVSKMLREKSIFFIIKVEKFFLLVATLSKFYDLLTQIHEDIDISVLCKAEFLL